LSIKQRIQLVLKYRACFLGPNSTPTDVFAAHVTKKLLKPVSPRYVTFGSTSWVFLVLYYLPHFIKDMIFYKKFGVYLLKKKQA
jgi:hypothetical protein